MAMATVKRTSEGVVLVEGRMTIPNAWELKEGLIRAAFEGPAEGKGVLLDLSGVEDMDTSGLQLLLLLRREALARGLGFRVLAAARAAEDVFSLLGEFTPSGTGR